MEDPVTIEGEAVELGEGELVVRQPPAQALASNLFGTDDPDGVIEKASKTASALAGVIDKQELFNIVKGKKYVRVEGWTLLGSMLGVFPVLESCEPVEQNGVKGYKAVVAAQTPTGNVIGRASALCMRNETRWASADEYAVSSMAQTRATSKCLRAPLGFIMQLAGYEATPEAEVPEGGFTSSAGATAAPASPPVSPPVVAPVERVNSLTLARVENGLEKLKGKQGWSVEEVLQTATRTFGYPVASIGALKQADAEKIIAAMEQYGEVKV